MNEVATRKICKVTSEKLILLFVLFVVLCGVYFTSRLDYEILDLGSRIRAARTDSKINFVTPDYLGNTQTPRG